LQFILVILKLVSRAEQDVNKKTCAEVSEKALIYFSGIINLHILGSEKQFLA